MSILYKVDVIFNCNFFIFLFSPGESLKKEKRKYTLDELSNLNTMEGHITK